MLIELCENARTAAREGEKLGLSASQRRTNEGGAVMIDREGDEMGSSQGGGNIVLITGASGFIAAALIAKLSERYTVIGLDRTGPHRHRRRLGAGRPQEYCRAAREASLRCRPWIAGTPRPERLAIAR